jgi:hypothetical protein
MLATDDPQTCAPWMRTGHDPGRTPHTLTQGKAYHPLELPPGGHGSDQGTIPPATGGLQIEKMWDTYSSDDPLEKSGEGKYRRRIRVCGVCWSD